MAGNEISAIGSRACAADLTLVDYRDLVAVARQVVGAGDADVATTNDNDTISHARIPLANGSPDC